MPKFTFTLGKPLPTKATTIPKPPSFSYRGTNAVTPTIGRSGSMDAGTRFIAPPPIVKPPSSVLTAPAAGKVTWVTELKTPFSDALNAGLVEGLGRVKTGVAGAVKMVAESDAFRIWSSRERSAVSAKMGELVSSTESWIQQYQPQSMTTFQALAKDLVSGAVSIFSSIGMGLVTGSARASATLFGILQAGDKYVEMRKKGVSKEKAGGIASAQGFVEAALEGIGLTTFLKLSRGTVWNTLMRAGTEAVQEASQSLGENVLDVIWDPKQNIGEGVARSALIGGLLGLPAAVSVSAYEQTTDYGKAVRRVAAIGPEYARRADDIVRGVVFSINDRVSPLVDEALREAKKDIAVPDLERTLGIRKTAPLYDSRGRYVLAEEQGVLVGRAETKPQPSPRPQFRLALAESTRRGVPIGTPVTTGQTVAPSPSRIAIPAQASTAVAISERETSVSTSPVEIAPQIAEKPTLSKMETPQPSAKQPSVVAPVKWGKWIEAIGTRRTDGVGTGQVNTIKTPVTYRLASGSEDVRAYAPGAAAESGVSGPWMQITGKRLELKGDPHTYYVTQKSEKEAIAEGTPKYRPFSVIEASSGNIVGRSATMVKNAIANAQETINANKGVYNDRVTRQVEAHGEIANPVITNTAPLPAGKTSSGEEVAQTYASSAPDLATSGTSPTIPATVDDIARITMAFDDIVKAKREGKLTKATEGTYQKMFLDALKAAGVPKGALTWKDAIAYYKNSKGNPSLESRLSKVAKAVERYNAKVLGEKIVNIAHQREAKRAVKEAVARGKLEVKDRYLAKLAALRERFAEAQKKDDLAQMLELDEQAIKLQERYDKKVRKVREKLETILWKNMEEKYKAQKEAERKSAIAAIASIESKATLTRISVETWMGIDALMSRYRKGQLSPSHREELEETRAWMNEHPDEEMPAATIAKLEELNKTALSGMTIQELQALKAKLETLYAKGKEDYRQFKRKQELQKEQDIRLVEKEGRNLGSVMRDKISNPKAMAKNTLEHIKMGELFRTTAQRLFNRLGIQKLKALFDERHGHYSFIKAEYDRQVDDAVNAVGGLTVAEREHLTLYAMKMQGRSEMLTDLFGMTDEEIEALELTDKERPVYEAVRRINDALFPSVQMTAARVYNKAVFREPNFTHLPIGTGEEISFQETPDRLLSSHFHGLTKTTEQGFTIDRKAYVTSKPEMDFILSAKEYIRDAVYFIDCQPVLKRMFEAFNSPRAKTSLGEVGQALVKLWVDVQARQGGVDSAYRIVALDRAITKATYSVMGFKVLSGFVQFTSVVDAIALIGPEAYMRGSVALLNPEWRTFLSEQASDIFRGETREVELAPILSLTGLRKWSMAHIIATDALVRRANWLGAYYKYCTEHGMEFTPAISSATAPQVRAAITYASTVTTQAQGSTLAKELPLAISAGAMDYSVAGGKLTIRQNKSIMRAIHHFGTFNMYRYNNIKQFVWTDGFAKGNWKKGMAGILWLWLMGTITEAAIRRGYRELREHAFGLESAQQSFWMDVLKGSVEVVPFVGPIISLFDYGNDPIPILQMVRDAAAGINSAVTGKSWQTKTRGIATAIRGVGGLTGIPGASQVAQIARDIIPVKKAAPKFKITSPF